MASSPPFQPDWSTGQRIDVPLGPALPARGCSREAISRALSSYPPAVLGVADLYAAEVCVAHPNLRPAAVLLLITPLGVLLTRRPDHLRHHAGQMSLPGGACEPDDCDAIDTACRETAEEVGIDRAGFVVLGELPTMPTRSGFCIHPVVAWADEQPDTHPDPSEVDQIHYVALDLVLNPSRYHRVRWPHSSIQDIAQPAYETWRLDWPGPPVWGATAGLLRCLYWTVAQHALGMSGQRADFA